MRKKKLPPRWLREKRKGTEREIIRLKEIEICRLENNLRELIERPDSDRSSRIKTDYYEAKIQMENMHATLEMFKNALLDNSKPKQ